MESLALRLLPPNPLLTTPIQHCHKRKQTMHPPLIPKLLKHMTPPKTSCFQHTSSVLNLRLKVHFGPGSTVQNSLGLGTLKAGN